MAIEVFNRYEYKYLLDKQIFERVISVMDSHMILDSHNFGHKPYTIANIYYDTEDDHLIRESLSGPSYKEKLRLRAYGVPKNEDHVFLEIKKKYRGLVNKRRTELRLDEAYDFVRNGLAPVQRKYMNRQVIREIEYFIKIRKLIPKVYVAYDRIAYFEDGNPDLRISFDMNIRTRRYDVRLESGDHGKSLLRNDVYLMEIKTARAMPLWLTNMLNNLDIHRCSFSKYGTEFKNTVKQTDKELNQKNINYLRKEAVTIQ